MSCIPHDLIGFFFMAIYAGAGLGIGFIVAMLISDLIKQRKAARPKRDG